MSSAVEVYGIIQHGLVGTTYGTEKIALTKHNLESVHFPDCVRSLSANRTLLELKYRFIQKLIDPCCALIPSFEVRLRPASSVGVGSECSSHSHVTRFQRYIFLSCSYMQAG